MNYAPILRLWRSRFILFLALAVCCVLVIHVQDAVELVLRDGRPDLVWHGDRYLARLVHYVTKIQEHTYQQGGTGPEVPVLKMIQVAWFHSFQLFVAAVSTGGLIGILVGSLVALRRRLASGFAFGVSLFGLSLPDFFVVVAMHGIAVWAWNNYGIRLWYVLAAPRSLQEWAVPLVVLSLAPMGFMARLTASALDEVMYADYIRTARAKGLPPWRIIFGHALRNAIIRILSGLPAMLNTVMTSLIIVEGLTNWPGIARWLLRHPLNRIPSEILATAGVIFIAWFLLVDTLAHTLRLLLARQVEEVEV